MSKGHAWAPLRPLGHRRQQHTLSCGVTALFAACIFSSARGQSPHTLVLKQSIALPEVHGGFNHMSLDVRRRRLFAPAPADHVVEVLELASGKLWRTLRAMRPTTALYAPKSNQLYLTSGHNLLIYDGGTLDRRASIDLHSRLDELQYDPGAHELLVGRMSAGQTGIAILAVPEGKLVASIALPSSPQGFALEAGGPRVYVNLPDAGAVAVIDRRKRELIATWELQGASDNFPMALDEDRHRLFIAARGPPQMLVLDTRTGSIITRIRCVADADDMWYDAALGRVYISGGGGFISVVEQQDAGRYRLLEQIRTAPEASNSAFSSSLESLYVGVPSRNREAAEILVYGAAR